MILSLFSLALSILMLISQGKMFQKAGHEWWEILIPIYSLYVLADIACRRSKFFLALGSGIALGISSPLIMASIAVGAKQREVPFSGGGTLMIIGFIIMIIASILTLYASISINFGLAESFGKEKLFGLLLTFVPVIGFPIIGLSDDVQYVGGSTGGGKDVKHYSGETNVPDYSAYFSDNNNGQ